MTIKLKLCFSIFATIVLLLNLSACQQNEKITEKLLKKIDNPSSERLIKIDESMNDDELADAGEQLMVIHTVPLAEKAFQMALLKNPDNLKAQFYTEGFLKNYTVMKGILTRIKPLVRNQGKIKNLEKIISELPSIPLRKFLLDGKEDIETIADVQNFLSDQQTNWNNFRKWLIKNYDRSLTLNLDPYWLMINSGIEGKHSCEYIDEKEGKVICNYDNIFQKKLAPPDLMALRQMVAGQVLFYNIYTAYNYDGFDQLYKFDPKDSLTTEQRYKYLMKVAPNVFTLRDRHLMGETLSIGADLAEAFRYAIKYKDQLCPKGYGQTRQRPGFLVVDGICVNNRDNKLELLDQALKGVTSMKLEKTGTQKGSSLAVEEEEVRVDIFSWFRKPIKDLKTLGPARFNECGEGEGLLDKTFGGFFVDQNAEDFVAYQKCKSLPRNY